MSKPATNAAGEFHRCPKNPEAGDIRVKGFSFCPFCGDHISGFGEHNVVQMRPLEPSPHAPPPAPEPEPADCVRHSCSPNAGMHGNTA
mgnify:CR=1 FL=1